MGRREKVAVLVQSIETLYPRRFKIIIGDDGEHDEGDLYQSEGILEAGRIRYFWFGFNVGVSVGRNRLVSLCDTKYAINMDDDMFWTSETNIYSLFRVFQQTKADIVTMSLVQDGERKSYLGEIYVEKNMTPAKTFCKHRYPPLLVLAHSNSTAAEKTHPSTPSERTHQSSAVERTHRSTATKRNHRITPIEGTQHSTTVKGTPQRIPIDTQAQCYQTEVGFTMFFSTQSFLASNPRNGVIGQEHIEWFWNMKQRKVPAKVVGCLNITVIHNYWGYSKFWDVGYWTSYRKLRGKFKMNRTNYWNYLAEDNPKCGRLRSKSRREI